MLVAEALVLVLALLLAIVRGLPGRAALPLRAAAIVYTDFFRGTPLILVLLIVQGFRDNSTTSGSRARRSSGPA
jgi:ABC-type amino acid transport system, permease component